MEHIKDYEAMAKLDLSEDERRRIYGLAVTLTSGFDALENIDTEGVEPLYTVLEVYNEFREDIAIKALTREELLTNAPERRDGFFQAPRTI